MTLIFSNDNRFLFSREGSDRLLELCYANRFAALSNYKKLYKQPITSLDRRFKPNKDLFCTTPLGPKKKEKEGNRSYKAELSPNSLPILGPGRKPNSFKASLFCLVESQDTASLALQSFSAAEILSLYGLLQDQPVLIQGLLKSCFACARGFTSTPAIDKPFDLSQTESKQLQARSIKPLNFLCKKSNPASKSCKALNRACTGRALASKAATKPTPCSCMRFSSLDLKNKHRLHRFLLSGNPSTKQLQNPGISEALPTGPLVATSGPVGRGLVFLKGNKEWIDRALVPDGLVLLKKKVSKIKQLFPKARVWSFAFGSSFLLVSMTSILQRHDEGRWFLTLSKNQMPGLSAISEESSWESFENITLKHLNRKNVASKKPTGKGLVKEIDCYSDVWRISFSRSWNQQLFQGYTAVFPPRAQGLATKKRSTALDENQRNAQGSLPGTQNPFFVGCPVQENRDESCHLPGALHVEQGKLGNGFSIRGNRWFAPPWYQMHARTPPKKRLSICKILPDRGELCARKGRARLAGAGQSVACKGTPWTRFVRSFRAALTKGGGYRERLNVENDSIPSKMSCSTGAPSPSFCDSRVKPKLAPDSSQHDRLKDLFYGPRNLSIDTQVFQENSQEAESLHDLSFSLKKRKSDFEELIHRNRFSFLQETSFFKADTDLSPEQEKPSFGYPLKPAKRDNSQKRAFPLKGKRGYQSSRHALRMKDDENAFRETRSFKPEMACPSLRVNSAKPDTSSCITGLAKPAERLSNYSLYKRNSVSNRLMSGYRAPETKGLHLKRMACLCRAAIKVPPALPFYESKVKEWALPLQNNAPRYFPKHPSIPASFNNLLFKKPFIKADAPLPAVRPLKRMPYRKLFLNLSKDIEPLFEQVNKAFRISPYHLTFKRSLFADYNDYLGWSKDTPAGISIAPSVEEEESIKNSWLAEQALSRGLKGLQGDPIPESLPQGGEGVEDRVLLVAEPSAPSDNEEGDNGNGGERLQSPAGTDLSGLTKKDSFLAEEEALSASLPVGEDDDKKREITRFEWLQQVREAEYMVEKRKDFQGVAYPNREALASNRLDVKPGMTRSLLVGDRKLSFFGIANLFPKRLVAQDQKQINLQILREEHDQRSRLLLEELSSEDGMLSPIALEGEEGVSIEDLLKSGALYNLSKRLERFDLLSSKRAPSTKSQHTSMLLQSEALLGAGGFATKIPSSLSAVGEKPELSQRLCSCKGKQIPSSLRTAPRNRQKSDAPAKQSSVQGTHNSYKACAKLAKPSCKAPDKPCTGQSVVSKAELCSGSCNPLSQSHLPLTNTNKRFVKSFVRGSNKASLCKALFSERQHPIYAPNRRLRLRAPQLSFSSQGSNPQSRLDDLNLSQSHRWWQKRRTTSSLLGAPSRRYLAMPEITTQDWRRIVEWQLKTYLLEEERRLEPLVLEKSEIRKTDLQGSPLQETLLLESERLGKTNHLFKIKRIAVYLPWTTVKKRLKKPFEWPLTGLSFQSLGGGAHETVEQNKNSRAFLVAHKGTSCVLSAPNKASDKPCTRLTIRSTKLLRNRRFVIARSKALLAKPCKKLCKESFTTNKKPDSCFISSISPHFKASQSNQAYQPGTPTGSSTEKRLNSLHETSVYKPFLFEARTKYSYLVVHQLLLAVATKQLFQSIYKTFERVLTHKIKNSSLALLLLPILFNATSQRDQIPEFSHLKKRLKDLAGDDDTVSSLSEIVWYLRNSCRGRMMPRGVVLVESLSSESTDYLKAIGGEAQVPVIVQSLRALPFTQNHPQRRLEKILTFAQKRAPCILFLDDLDSIGQSRTLLLKNNSTPFLRGLGTKDSPPSKTEPFSVANKTLQGEALYKLFKPFNQIAGSSSERLEKKKWKEGPNRGNSLAYKATDLQDVALYAELCSCKASSKQGLARFGSLGGKVKHRSSPVHPWSSHFRYKPSVQQEQANKRLAGQGLRPSPDGVKGENNVLQLSETEKTIEQRRVDLMLRLLTVMDGITDFNGVLIVTTSKDPSSLDPALLRPGRFEKLVNIRLPNKKKRIELLKLETARIGHTSVMPWEYLGSQTQGMTGTEISSAVNHSAFRAILQSTVHTFPTLEYGISCTNGDGSLPQNLEAQLENRFQRGVKTKEVNGHTRTTGFSACFLRESGVQNPYKALLNNSGGLSTKSCKRQACLPASRGFAQKDANKAELCKHELCKQVAFHPSLNMSQNQQRCQQGRGVTSQISFYQAGRGLVRSSIVPANKLSAQPPLTNFSRARPGDKAVQSFAHVQGSCLGDPHKALPCKNSSTRTCFAKNIVRLYAGQAAESLYLDSTAAFKNKAKADPLSQLPSTFSYKERSKASSTVAGIATNSGFYPGTSLLQSFARVCRAKTSQSSSDLTKVCKTDSFPQVRAQRLYRAYIYNDPNKACTRLVGGFTSQKLCNSCKQRAKQKALAKMFASPRRDLFCFQGIVRKLQHLGSTNFFKKGFHVGYNRHSHLRKCLRRCRDNGICNKILLKEGCNRVDKSSFWTQKISGALKTFKRPSGNWYRLYLPKVEQNKNNREWVLPDFFSNQHISILDLKGHVLKPQASSKTVDSRLPWRKKVCPPAPVPVHRDRLFKEKEGCADSLYYNMVLSGFYVAFQSCAENRELLDLLADHLIRFKAVRLHEIARIACFYF